MVAEPRRHGLFSVVVDSSLPIAVEQKPGRVTPVPQTIKNLVMSMPRVFGHLDLRAVLTNGKMEGALKTLLGITWVAQAEGRNYLMDKRLNRAAIDLVALDNRTPIFWMETKCDFAKDRTAAFRSAETAVEQVRRYTPLLQRHKELRGKPGYIVHFLCPLPDEPDLDWFRGFSRLRKKKKVISPRELESWYRQKLKSREMNGSTVVELNLRPIAEVVVIRLAWPLR
jgi:hypothetical protein